MATRVSVESAFRGVEVELWDGAVYETVDLSRDKGREALDALNRAEEAEKDDEAIEHWGEYFDLILSGIEDTRTKPSTLIKKHYKAGEFGPKRLVGLLGDIGAAEQAEAQKARELFFKRPT